MKKRVAATLVVLLILYAQSAFADGGTVLTAVDRERYRITVLTSPTPLRTGPVDVSVLVQDRDTGKVVTDARVEVLLSPSDSNERPVRSLATSEAATNKLFRAALVTLPRPGRWRLSNVVTIGDRQVQLETDIEAVAAQPQFSDLWFWTGWPLIAIGLFTVHRRLVQRYERKRSKRNRQRSINSE